jgi:gliding motility-associated-like protein
VSILRQINKLTLRFEKMKVFCQILFFLSISPIIFAQNIVPNGDFEIYTSLPNNTAQFYKCVGWGNANSPSTTPDYYHTSGLFGSHLPNSAWTNISPHSGNAIMGFLTYSTTSTSSNFREYITVQLSTPMIIGHTYSVSFHLSNGTPLASSNGFYSSGFSSNRVGLGFSTSALNQNLNAPLGGIGMPQIEIPGQVWSTTWQSFTYTYLADQTYTHLTIGNFYTDANTTVVYQAPYTGSISSYYFIDQLAIIDLNPNIDIIGSPAVCLGDSITLTAINDSIFSWVDSLYPNIVLSTDSILTVAPTIPTTYLVYGTIDTASFTVNINYPPNLDLGQDTILCPGQDLLLDAYSLNATYVWQDNSNNATFLVTQAGTYWTTISDSNCSITDTIHVTYDSIPMVNLGSDTLLCINETFLLDATSTAVSYLWQDSSTDSTYNVTQQGTYWVELSTLGNCKKRDTININYIVPISLDLGPDLWLCPGETTTFDASTLNSSYLWQNGDTTAFYDVTQTGQYFVDVTNSCETISDTVTVTYFVPPIGYLGNDTIVCDMPEISISVNLPNSQTQWQDQTISDNYLVTQTGTYTASTTMEGCLFSDQISIEMKSTPLADLGPDLIICEFSQLLITNQSADQGTFLWNTGSTDNQIQVYSFGIYSLQLSNECGSSRDTVSIEDKECSCFVYLSNSFTPDQDEFNNSYGPKHDCSFIAFNLKIYNRWGEMIWESNDPDAQWDGTYQGKTAPQGVYIYKLKYSSEQILNKVISGHVQLLR